MTIDKTLTHGVLNALEEIQRYRKIGTVKECQDAMEKSKPKELEKILDKIEEAARLEDAPIYCGNMVVDGYVLKSVVEDIIRKHMSGSEADAPDKDGWIPVEKRLPGEKINPVTQDFCEYQVTAKFGDIADVRYYKFGNGHWWHGPGVVDKFVVAWRPNPEPYHPKAAQSEKPEGTFYKTPCHLGDTVYFLWENSPLTDHVIPCRVKEFRIGIYGMQILVVSLHDMVGHYKWHDIKEIGKDLFLSKEEAEEEWKNRKGNGIGA